MIRSATTRILAQPRRTLSTAPSDADTILEAFEKLGLGLTAPTPAPRRPSRLPPPIPPAEDPLLRYLTSLLLTHGHRAKASRITARTLLHVHTLTRAPPLPILRAAVLAAAPAVRTMMHRQGAKNVAKPVALGEKQRARFALQWILGASEKRTGQTVEERLARELVAVLQGTSEALRRKEEVHRFAMVNRGNAQARI